jgi:hypothetical protein
MDMPTADSVERKDILEAQFDAAERGEDVTPQRDDQGRFAPRQAAQEATQQQAATNTAPATPEAVKAAEDPLWKRPPASWKKDYHEPWATVDDRVKEYVWQREEQMRKGVEPLLTKAQFADKMQQALDPYMNTIRGMGLEPDAAVAALAKADYTLRTSDAQAKMQMFAQLAQQYGVDLNALMGQPQQGQQQQSIDPRYIALQNELNAVRGEVVGWKQQQQEAQNAVLQNEIESFAQRAEHFDTVRPTMVQLLQTGIAQDLQDAYDKAIRLDPELQSSIQQAQQVQQNAQRSAGLDKAAKAARAAAVSVRSSTPGTNTAPKAQDRRSLLAEQFDGMESRI